MINENSPVERRAQLILAGQTATAEELTDLVKALHQERQFGLARKVLARLSRYKEVAGDPSLRLWAGQKLALSTYKDPDLNPDARLTEALQILRGVENLETTVNQETLGLAGAIHKRMWEQDGRERHLETAYAFYLRGFQQGVESDYGYTGINAAFVFDLLADLEIPQGTGSLLPDDVRDRIKQAQDIRRAIVSRLPSLLEVSGNQWLAQKWWYLVTLAEAYFGLSDFDQADAWVVRAAALENVPDWERESTARQFAALMRIMRRRAQISGKPLESRATEVLRHLVGNAEAALSSVVRGRIGLALSGGGFRASLYHIGVLARLAELDLLRHVEYLSCVSGGSIVGAHYYLEVRKLLSSKADRDITREDYIEIVERVRHNMLAGIQRNIRTRVAAEWFTNVKMILFPDYSRTKRAGELYEREFYAHVDDGEGSQSRWLNELRITPLGERKDFRPKDHNWYRAAKAPILILNATSLNTGHNWQFTASWMGEPPAGIDDEVDASCRLRRMYYEQAPKPHNRIRLGHAVAASACVPGIFEPLPLPNLYERTPLDGDRKVRPVVRLVDGGVYDNQGTAALVEQGCSVLLVSDASGQIAEQDSPSDSPFRVPLRANSILQSRVRVSQYEDLRSRQRAGTLKGLLFVHLKKDLDNQPIDWIDCQDPSDPWPNSPLTSYGIQKGIQRKLASIRTDLDSFSDVEACALMTSGYLATETALKQPVLGFDVEQAPRRQWPFLEILPLLEQPSSTTPLTHWLERQLSASSKLALKVFVLKRNLQAMAALAALALLIAAVWKWRVTLPVILHYTPFTEVPTVGSVLYAAFLAALSVSGFALVAKVLNYRKTIREIALGIVMATVGFLLARLHLHFFDPLFLRQGRLPLVLRETQTAAVKERLRSIEQRAASLEVASRGGERISYAVQQSEGFLLSAKRNLDPATESKVTQAIFRLSDDPHSAKASPDPETQLLKIQVPGTSWRIAFDVDDERKRVRIHYLTRDLRAGGRPV